MEKIGTAANESPKCTHHFRSMKQEKRNTEEHEKRKEEKKKEKEGFTERLKE